MKQDFEVFPGIYRGVVQTVDDPETRKRYRVRVTNVHPAEVEANHLPWAELGTIFGGSLFGDIPGYEVDDQVWVMFEGGNRRFPVIMGGIFNNAGGVPPLPAEQVGDEYVRQAKRWVRTDRAGNKIEMSPLEDELYVRIQTTDGSTIEISAIEGGITLTGSGRVLVQAPSVQVEAENDITCIADTIIADVATNATVRSAGVTNIRAAGEVNIGQYQPEDTTGVGAQPVETTPTINIQAATLIKIESAGTIDVDSAGDMLVDVVGNLSITGGSALSVDITGDTTLNLQGDAQIDVAGTTDLNLTGNCTADISGTLEVASVDSMTITCQADVVFESNASFRLASGATMTIDSSADLTINSTASLDIATTANLSLRANGQLSLDAQTIAISATSLLNMQGGSTAQLDAGFILIG